jgi:hypothetical protein
MWVSGKDAQTARYGRLTRSVNLDSIMGKRLAGIQWLTTDGWPGVIIAGPVILYLVLECDHPAYEVGLDLYVLEGGDYYGTMLTLMQAGHTLRWERDHVVAEHIGSCWEVRLWRSVHAMAHSQAASFEIDCPCAFVCGDAVHASTDALLSWRTGFARCSALIRSPVIDRFSGILEAMDLDVTFEFMHIRVMDRIANIFNAMGGLWLGLGGIKYATCSHDGRFTEYDNK